MPDQPLPRFGNELQPGREHPYAAAHTSRPEVTTYDRPAGGWGSARSLAKRFTRDGVPLSVPIVLNWQNKPHGFACVSCSWAKPAVPHPFEYCENGAKATSWELTVKRCRPEFFAEHTAEELRGWTDHALESTGRLTHPLRFDPVRDTYVPVLWEEAFAEIGRELRALDPKSIVAYTSGRASLETSYMYQLWARMYGSPNLPDSSNMCHETTSVALPESIGAPVGTVTLEDFHKTDAIFFFGQNPGTNAPRMLHDLQDCARRGVPIVTFNPLRERGLIAFTNPQSPTEMLSGSETRISTQYHQVKAGGDLAAIVGICKVLLDMEDAGEKVLDRLFIEEHTHGFDKFAKFVRAEDWSSIEQCSGLTRGAITKAARVYAKAEAVMLVYGMGLTQHREGVATIRTMVNLALMRGNIGRQGAGILPVRGHSNVQGQRTVGITEKPELVPLDTLSKMFNFEPPREKGLNTVEACEGILDGRVRGFIGLGGNLLRAVPDQQRLEPAWRRMRLTVHIATKLNRTHIFPGEVCYLLPCLGRTEIDVQATGPQSVSVEDSTGCFHGSRGVRTPASPHLLSEPAIVAGIAKASLRPNPNIDWDAWVADYGKVRDAIAETWPEDFHDFNKRMWTPGGFHRHIAAASRVWKTKTGKANFITPESLESETDMQQAKGPDVLRLITLRSNDQFNTTIYGYDDRFRGIHGTRMVVLMNGSDIARLRLREGDRVELQTVADDGHDRRLGGLSVVAYDIPEGCIAGYYPECNSLIPLWHHAKGSKTPAAKSIPVRVRVWHAPPLLAAE